jgi:hypothetical protein
MNLHTPIRVNPNSTVGLYVHSACLGDEQIVYANQRHKVRGRCLVVFVGMRAVTLEPTALTYNSHTPAYPTQMRARARSLSLSLSHVYTHTNTHTHTHTHHARTQVSHSDMFLDILPGVAHLSDEPFSPTHNNWGGWGSPWRERREFVGAKDQGSGVMVEWLGSGFRGLTKGFGSRLGFGVWGLECQVSILWS